MKIQFINNISTNFEGTKLFQAKVPPKYSKGGKNTLLDAFITEIGIEDMPQIYSAEHERLKTGLGEDIIDALYKSQKIKSKNEKARFFAVEVPNKRGIPKIRAMAMATENKKKQTIRLNFLQSFHAPKGERQIKGAGSCLLYAITNDAKKLKSLLLDLYSTDSARKFYKKYGFVIVDKYSHCELRPSRYTALLGKIQKKYSIRSILKK